MGRCSHLTLYKKARMSPKVHANGNKPSSSCSPFTDVKEPSGKFDSELMNYIWKHMKADDGMNASGGDDPRRPRKKPSKRGSNQNLLLLLLCILVVIYLVVYLIIYWSSALTPNISVI